MVLDRHLNRKSTLWWLNAHREVLKTLLGANEKFPSKSLTEDIEFFSQRIKELKTESESL